MEDQSSMFGSAVLCVRIVDVKCLILMCTMAKILLGEITSVNIGSPHVV